jgi:diacylglycerol kinase
MAEMQHEGQNVKGKTPILRSFQFVFAGIVHFLRTQRHARFHVAAAIAVAALAGWLHVSHTDWAILILTIGLVLALESVNTAIEAAVDLSSPQPHPLAKVAKDVAAAAVLIAAMAAVGVGIAILGPPLWDRLKW